MTQLKQATVRQQEVVFLQTYFVITAFYTRQKGFSHFLIQLHQTGVLSPFKLLIKSFLARRFRKQRRKSRLRLKPYFTNLYPLKPNNLVIAPRFYLQ